MTRYLRLQVALARLGFASRRNAVKIIKAGRVKVNGQIILEPGQRIELAQQDVTVDGKNSSIPKKVYFILNKPKDIVTTVKDKHARRSVLDLVKFPAARIYPVGRLDKDTTGVLLLTNDGELAYRLTHPSFEVPKAYRVFIRGQIQSKKLRQLETGIMLEGRSTYPCKIKIITSDKHNSLLEVRLSEGRNRQLKKMFGQIGHPVLAINRIAFGPLKALRLKVGQWRQLSPAEVEQLKRVTGVEGN